MLRMAERDLRALEVLTSAVDVHFSILCFHAQQVVEKAFKSVLFCFGIEFRRTHDLELLLALMKANAVETPLVDRDIALLGPCAVQMRYDDTEIEIELLSSGDLQRITTVVYRWASTVVTSLVAGDQT
jgi:HEPN domain-containing protein